MQTTIAPVKPESFRAALATFTSGVTIVTFRYEGICYGLTVSSFCSLSLDPPLVLVCIDRRCRCHGLLEKAASFAVNILPEDSGWLASHFAGKCVDRFTDVPYSWGDAGTPLLNRSLSNIECQLEQQFPGGDHSIFIGKVVATRISDNTAPLVYQRRRYQRLAQE